MKKNGLPYSNKPGFKVPENYFETFESRMLARVAEEEGFKFGTNPFKVPDNYFDEFETKMLLRLDNSPKKVKVIPLFRRKAWSYVAGVAAVAAIFFSSVLFNEQRDLTFEDLELTAVENYLLESLDLDNPNENPYNNYDFTASANPNIDKEALFEYLNENIEEPALLLNEN